MANGDNARGREPVGVVAAVSDRRDSDRVRGPFDAWRISLLDTPIRIYDISVGGCFVNAMHEQEQGVVVMLRLQMPDASWLNLRAQTLYRRPGFGFAVRFIDMDDSARARLSDALRVWQAAALSGR